MRGWTHRICDQCWQQKHPDRGPIQVTGIDEGVCCFCGGQAGGIYVRADPRTLKCEGKGPEHEDSEP